MKVLDLDIVLIHDGEMSPRFRLPMEEGQFKLRQN